jgi:hypothetical protein
MLAWRPIGCGVQIRMSRSLDRQGAEIAGKIKHLPDHMRPTGH